MVINTQRVRFLRWRRHPLIKPRSAAAGGRIRFAFAVAERVELARKRQDERIFAEGEIPNYTNANAPNGCVFCVVFFAFSLFLCLKSLLVPPKNLYITSPASGTCGCASKKCFTFFASYAIMKSY